MQQVVAPHMAAASLTLSVVAAHILAGGVSLSAAEEIEVIPFQ